MWTFLSTECMKAAGRFTIKNISSNYSSNSKSLDLLELLCHNYILLLRSVKWLVLTAKPKPVTFRRHGHIGYKREKMYEKNYFF